MDVNVKELFCFRFYVNFHKVVRSSIVTEGQSALIPSPILILFVKLDMISAWSLGPSVIFVLKFPISVEMTRIAAAETQIDSLFSWT